MMKWGIRKRGTLAYYVGHPHWSENIDLAQLFDRIQDAQHAVCALECAGFLRPSAIEYVPFALKYAPIEGVVLSPQ